MKPILFNTEMIKAILNGRKTQTRRIINPQPNAEYFKHDKELVSCEKYQATATLLRSPKTKQACFIEQASLFYNKKGSKYQVGDILYVRETWNTTFDIENKKWLPIYKANDEIWIGNDTYMRWKPSIFMPKIYARLFLKITNVKVEQLQDISEQDAICEGIFYNENTDGYRDYLNPSSKGNFQCLTPKASFMTLWKKIHGVQNWNENPFVWVYEFEIIEK